MQNKTLITGFPRIGENRELKKTLEKFWAGEVTVEELENTSFQLKTKNWSLQKEKGIDLISCNDFSYYDNMLDTAIMLNAVPKRYRSIENETQRYFAMARGTKDVPAMEMTKWFNTNYHFIVPELENDMDFRLNASKLMKEFQEAKNIGIRPKINIIGPITFLGLCSTVNEETGYDYFKKILPVYEQLLTQIADLDDEIYVQMDEPIFVKDPTGKQLSLLKTAYQGLASISNKIKMIVTTYFEHSTEATAVLATIPIWGIGLDFIYGERNIETLPSIGEKILIVGIVDGRNIWINDLEKSLELLNKIADKIPPERIILSTSCSLLHVPYTVQNESDSSVKPWMSFAYEKLDELSVLSGLFFRNPTDNDLTFRDERNRVIEERKHSNLINNPDVTEKLKNLDIVERQSEYEERIKEQNDILKLPLIPTTTIGSFPQTPELRKVRRDYKADRISKDEYESYIKSYIDDCVEFQEKIGLDVLVHGEPERNDMVEYFGEMLDGFHFTRNGWVQSYGSRCVKPPVIYGDISRPFPMTVQWITYAQSKTTKPMKGMLTGPITIMNWSFVRTDIPRAEISKQIAVALSDEIRDLQNNGIKIIQVDEAAFKEGYPLRKDRIPEYEKFAVSNFKLAVSTAHSGTQIHTHMCYSEFKDIIKTIEKMDADVITIETARSGNDLLTVFQDVGYQNQIGPGVYDIHSPRVPSVVEFEEQIRTRLQIIPPDQLWINPDCGLKTRKWEEVIPAMKNMVEAINRVRVSLK